jgi:uncharacterized protein
VNDPAREPHYPGAAAIEGYGGGGFHFAGMSHRGSILVLPDGIWAWPPAHPSEIDEVSLAKLFATAASVDLVFIGTGRDPFPLPEPLRRKLHDAGIRLEAHPTPAAASTYNVLFSEGRRVAAALIATE